ncbi:hypothetical protein C0584_05665, partial [Candidatus Parcubacteria bacterium]
MKNIFSKKQILVSLAAFVLVGIFFFGKSIFVDAAINPLLDFQGKIINSDGTNVASDVYDFEFKIYDDSVGGTLLWSEDLLVSTSFSGVISGVSAGASSVTYTYTPTQATSTLRVGQYLTNASASSSYSIITDIDTAINEITVASGTPWNIGDTINNRPRVDGGVAMLNLGTVTALGSLDFNSQMYLETTFNGEVMQPRKPFTSVSQSFNSAYLGGRGESDFAAVADNETVTGQWDFTDIVNVTASSTSAALTITQNGSGDLIDIKSGGTTAFSVLADGSVAIGTYILPPTRSAFGGYVLKTDASGNVTWQNDLVGFGGSGFWASSTGETLIRPIDTAMVVVIGDSSTSTSDSIFEVQGSSYFDDVEISNAQELRFYDAGDTNYFALKASSTLGTNRIFTLPTNAYLDEDSLMVDTNGNMYWGKRSGLWGTSGTNAYYTAGNILIGTTTDNSLLTVGATAGSQFLVNSSGQLTEGEWRGDAIAVQFGGTGMTSFGVGSILVGSSTDALTEILKGATSTLLSIDASGDYVWLPRSAAGTVRSDNEITDLAGALIATSSPYSTNNILTITYDSVTNTPNFLINTDLSQYDNGTTSYIALDDLTASSTSYLEYDNINGEFYVTSGRLIPLAASTT